MNSTTSEQTLPLGISDFAKLRAGNKVYVDKTDMICQLARRAATLISGGLTVLASAHQPARTGCVLSIAKQPF
jgi:hypothetical protein